MDQPQPLWRQVLIAVRQGIADAQAGRPPQPRRTVADVAQRAYLTAYRSERPDLALPPMRGGAIDAPAPTLEAALLAISGDCDGAHEQDGVGFNGRDAKFGNSLADQVRDGRRLTLEQRETALKMLRTYRGQLARAGIDYDALAAAEQRIAAPSMPSAPLIAVRPGRCAACGQTIAMGTEFRWGAALGERVHLKCPPVPIVVTGAPGSDHTSP